MSASALPVRQHPIVPEVVQCHAEDAASHWRQRCALAFQPHIRLADLAGMDERISADLDGLLVADVDGRAIVKQAFEDHPEPGEAFMAAWLVGKGPGGAEAIEAMAAIVADCQETLDDLGAGLSWASGITEASVLMQRFASSPLVHLHQVAWAMALRSTSLTPASLLNLTPGQDPRALSSACRLAAALGRLDLADAIRRHLRSDDTDLRFHAAWALALLTSETDALAILRWFATAKHAQAERAAIMAARRSPPADGQRWVTELMAQPAHRRIACIAAGAQGDPVFLPWLIEQMRVPAVARVSGEAFSMITGADLAYLDLDGDQPEGFEPPGPTDDPADPNVDLDPDGNLPWPTADTITAWLGKNGASFSAGQRHLCGQPITAAACQQVLRDGYQRQRAAAALELAFLQPGQPLFDVTAPALRQQRLLMH